MTKYKVKCNDDIVGIIMSIILKKHPIVDDRIETLMRYPAPAMDINLNFYLDKDNKQKISIMFFDGNDIYRNAINEHIEINNLILTSTLNVLINEILKDHDYIKYFGTFNNEIQLIFGVNLRDEAMKGIDCNQITLKLNFDLCLNSDELINDYFKSIVTTFSKQLRYTNWYVREYKKYIDGTKTQIINSLSEDQVHKFIDLLDIKDLCNILLKLPDECFLNTYNKIKSKQKTFRK